jgi:nicotinamide-nucleotide amidase
MDYSSQNAFTVRQKADRVLKKLAETGHRLVLAESCTCGLAAGFLGSIPGASTHFCGSMVVYQLESKSEWLGLDAAFLNSPEVGTVSERTSRDLARSILERTPHATIAVAITGHLGPNAPTQFDGLVYLAIASRLAGQERSVACKLSSASPSSPSDIDARWQRQVEAVDWLYDQLLVWLKVDLEKR